MNTSIIGVVTAAVLSISGTVNAESTSASTVGVTHSVEGQYSVDKTITTLVYTPTITWSEDKWATTLSSDLDTNTMKWSDISIGVNYEYTSNLDLYILSTLSTTLRDDAIIGFKFTF
jgi:hypothetical protein